jgi:hypothetical protein
MASEYELNADYKTDVGNFIATGEDDPNKLYLCLSVLVARVNGISPHSARAMITVEYNTLLLDPFDGWIVTPGSIFAKRIMVHLLRYHRVPIPEGYFDGCNSRATVIRCQHLLFEYFKIADSQGATSRGAPQDDSHDIERDQEIQMAEDIAMQDVDDDARAIVLSPGGQSPVSQGSIVSHEVQSSVVHQTIPMSDIFVVADVEADLPSSQYQEQHAQQTQTTSQQRPPQEHRENLRIPGFMTDARTASLQQRYHRIQLEIDDEIRHLGDSGALAIETILDHIRRNFSASVTSSASTSVRTYLQNSSRAMSTKFIIPDNGTAARCSKSWSLRFLTTTYSLKIALCFYQTDQRMYSTQSGPDVRWTLTPFS